MSGTVVALLGVLACGTREGRSSAAERVRAGTRRAVPFVPPSDTVAFRGVYRRDRKVSTFRICGTPRLWHVSAVNSVFDLLDANVDWHAPRPTTVVYVQVAGDTSGADRDSVTAGTLAVVALDSSRELRGPECDVPKLPRPVLPPPAEPLVVAAALRSALGADSGQARAGAFVFATAWLNDDEQSDLLVLLRSPQLCERQGCPLYVFEGTATGYRLVSRSASVVSPVVVRPERTDGWLDLQVRVNQGAFGLREVLLRRRIRGYPADAALEPGLSGRRTAVAPGLGTIVIR